MKNGHVNRADRGAEPGGKRRAGKRAAREATPGAGGPEPCMDFMSEWGEENEAEKLLKIKGLGAHTLPNEAENMLKAKPLPKNLACNTSCPPKAVLRLLLPPAKVLHKTISLA